MNKLTIFFFAALAFQATLARPFRSQEQHNNEVQDLLGEVRKISRASVSSLETVELEREVVRHSLYSQANEFAHDIHEVVHHLNQAIFHNKEGQSQETLKEVAERLSNIVHSVQRAIHNEPSRLRDELKSILETIIGHAEKLAQVAQEQQLSHDLSDDLEDILDDLLLAVHKIKIHNYIIKKTQPEVKAQIQVVTNQVSSAIQGVSSNDVLTIRELVHHSHHLAHHIGEIVHQLKREVDHHDGEVLNVIEQVLNKLTETRAHLERFDEETQVSELKTQLRTDVHNVAVQIERLVQLTPSAKLDEHETRNVKNLVRIVLVDALAAERQLQRDLEATAHVAHVAHGQNNQWN